MKINYGINRPTRQPHKRTHYENQCGSLKIRGNWDSQKTHDRIRQAIMDKHPGWLITGYCRVENA